MNPTALDDQDAADTIADVIRLPRIDQHRLEVLEMFVAGVPIAVSVAAQEVAILVGGYRGRHIARRRLEELRAQWHRGVDAAVDAALEEAS